MTASGQVLNEDVKLNALDAAANDGFSFSVAVKNGIVAVGAIGDDDNGSAAGAAYLYDAATGTQLFKLLASDRMEGDQLGWSIDIDGGIVAVGAVGDDFNTVGNIGSVYLFDVSTGAQIGKIFANDGALSDQFGYSVAIDNGIVAVGARDDDNANGADAGAAYVFDATTGTQLFKLLPSDGAAGDLFGGTIAIDNGIVAVGSRGDDDNGSGSGSAYLFDATTGMQLAKLLPLDGAGGDLFGYCIAIESGIVAVGAKDDNDTFVGSGSAYLFDAGTGAQLVKLVATDPVANDEFGWSIAIGGGIVAVGAHFSNDNGSNSGSAYLYDAATGSAIAKLLPSDGAATDQFGWSVAVDSGTVVVGSYRDDDGGMDSGSAYVFALEASPCPADTNGDGMLSPADFTAWIAAFNAQSPACDQNGNGLCTPADFTAWIANYNAGC